MRLMLIRHGQTVANAEGRFQGQMEYPLSEQGLREAQALGKWFAEEAIDVIYSSDLSRAFLTAEEVARYHSLSVIPKAELREINLGQFQGLTREEIKGRFPELEPLDWFSSGLAEVEQVDQVQQRGLQFIRELAKKHAGERVVAVSHGGFIGMTLMALLGIKWQGKRVFTIGNTSITTIDFSDPTHCLVINVNERPHLVDDRKCGQTKGDVQGTRYYI